MGLFDFLMRQIAGRAEARAALIQLGGHGTVDDLPALLPHLPPIDAFGEAASEAALRILDRASEQELARWNEHGQAGGGLRWHRLQAADLEASRDLGSIALGSFHPRAEVRAAAVARLEATPGALAARLARLHRAREA